MEMEKYKFFKQHFTLRSALLMTISILLSLSLTKNSFASDDLPLKEVKSEAGMYAPLKEKAKKRKKKKKKKRKYERKLSTYYERRAFHGAPPTIPHAVVNKKGKKMKCLSCHKKDRYVPKFKAYVPLSPHKEFKSCQQCHVVANKKNGLFAKGINWESYNPPKTNRSELPGAPMTIPHSFQMRESCHKCHAGPSALKEIRTKHPERLNCRQCHMNQVEQTVWKR
jgi:nitrate reductase cytochrome c-type subunit